ncbi:hypothetical protein PARPLA_01191 [Rhodobacteraceae bacterium THAF1]|uniref:tape measure protein n=1 Tax=Palleronia sp. THAF1 TaxID=2587842 RepID=UPI000F409F35|nr:tape measure protein [Palleronia sp. THAF1]QFU07286.1 hypothetical protein FIU81_01225 [Palleronia sp. THAF1]VDC20802.1 hypothetical protein PARPLA_01191 [Rhodobacteraceae bacterium THAF1]
MPIVDELISILGFEVRGEADAKRFEQRMDRIRNSMANLAVAATRWGTIAAGALAAGASVAGRSIVQTSAQFEGFRVQLETIEGSATAAQRSLDWITEFGKRTPYEVDGITEAFVRLKSQGIDPVADEAMRTLGDAASAMNEPLMRAVEAFTDASTFQFERLKAFGITTQQAGEDVVFSYTKNGKELQEVVQKNGEHIRRFLLDNFGERFTGAMDKQSRTFNGIVSNLADMWTDFQLKVGEAGFFDTVKAQLESLLGWVNRMDENGTLERWAKRFSDALTFATGMASDTVQRIGRHMTTLRDMFASDAWKPILQMFAGLFIALGIKMFPVMATLGLIAMAIDDILTWKSGGDSVFGSFLDWLERWAGIDLTGANEQLDGAATAADRMAGAVERLRDALRDVMGFFNANNNWTQRLDSLFEGMTGFDRSVIPNLGVFGGRESGGNSFDPEGIRSRLNQLQAQRSLDRNAGRNLPALGVELTDPVNMMRRGAAATINDSSDKSVNVNAPVTVNQTVTQATDAPRSAAEATGQAVSQSVGPAARVQSEGAR